MTTRKGITYETPDVSNLTRKERGRLSYYFCYTRKGPRDKVTVKSTNYDAILKSMKQLEKTELFDPNEVLRIVAVTPQK